MSNNNHQAVRSQPSRWDALGPSSSSYSYSARRTRQPVVVRSTAANDNTGGAGKSSHSSDPSRRGGGGLRRDDDYDVDDRSRGRGTHDGRTAASYHNHHHSSSSQSLLRPRRDTVAGFGNSWRRQHGDREATAACDEADGDDDNVSAAKTTTTTTATEEEERVREASNEVRLAVAIAFSDEKRWQGETGHQNDAEDEEERLARSVERMSSSLFLDDATDPPTTNSAEGSPVRFHRHLEANSSTALWSPSPSPLPLPGVSDDVLWEAGYSLLRRAREVSESGRGQRQRRVRWVLEISSVASACMRSLVRNQRRRRRRRMRNNDDRRSVGRTTRAMTDLRLCECASMLLDTLGGRGGESPLFAGVDSKTNNAEEEETSRSCKATLFSCLSQIISLSSRNGPSSVSEQRGSAKNANNARGVEKRRDDDRGPLFPWGAERTVNAIVGGAALPFIESLTRGGGGGGGGDGGETGASSSSVSARANLCRGAAECLRALLEDPNRRQEGDDDDDDDDYSSFEDGFEVDRRKSTTTTTAKTRSPPPSKHAAAMLAPLVVDVLPDGAEDRRANPLRARTLSAIGAYWELSCEEQRVVLRNEEKRRGGGGGASSNDGDDGSEPAIDDGTTKDVVAACRCMAAALRAARATAGGGGRDAARGRDPSADASAINASAVARRLQSVIRDRRLRKHRRTFLDLLTSLCSTFPSAVSAGQWHLFLEERSSRGGGGEAASSLPLLPSLLKEGASAARREGYDDDSWIDLPSALQATSTLLAAVPFALRISTATGGMTTTATTTTRGNLSTRVRNALLVASECALDLMTATRDGIVGRGGRPLPSDNDRLIATSRRRRARSMDIVAARVAEVAGRLCAVLPSYRGENSVLLRPATRIVQCAGDIYVSSVKLIASGPKLAEPELGRTLLYRAVSDFGEVITQSLGVDSSDSANVASCSAPAERWLSDASSYDFVGLLLTDSWWTNFPHSSKLRIEMLSSVARRSPWTLAREPFNLASFCEACAVQCRSRRDAESRISGLMLIESFLLGRKSLSADDDGATADGDDALFSAVPEAFCPLLLAALEDRSHAVRARAVSSFGSFLKRDWVDLFLSDAENVRGQYPINWVPLQRILSLCSVDEEKNANVRSSSCKAIGDICTACIGGTLGEEDDGTRTNVTLPDRFLLPFTCNICEVMANVLTDQNASVRSMALHAIGNTALALKEHCSERSPLQFPAMKHLFPSVCACLGDKDEKVVANAIRSISHIAYFVYHPEYASEIENNTLAALDLYRSLLSDLSAKITFALEDAAGETPRELTWKQRNGAKKHAWGSCTTLGTLLSFSTVLSCVDHSLAESAVASLFRCIQLSSVINEKIAAAAIKSLVNLPLALWHHLSCKCDSIGRGLATCFCFLQKRKSTTSYQHDAEGFAKLLVTSAKRTDFCNLFLIQEIVPFSVEYFYQWLVTNDVEASVLEEIATAAASQEVEHILDVSVVQMFLSRTIQQNRRQGSPCEISAASLPVDENGEEGDEL